MAVRKGEWKLHVHTRGSHCTKPFPDAHCYDFSFRNASEFASAADG